MPRILVVAAVALALATAACGGDETPAPAVSPSSAVSSGPGSPSATPADPPCSDEPCYGDAAILGSLDPDVIEGVSGMAASRRTPGLFYVVSDAAGTSHVAVVQEDGTPVAQLEIEGMSARNAEALAVGPCRAESEESCLFVGDIGNHADLPDLFVYRAVEPDLFEPPATLAADELRYTYPGSPTDAEALLVDGEGRPLIISKASFDEDAGTTGPTILYRGAQDGGVLEDLGEVELPEPEAPVFAELVGHVVTGADAFDGRVLLRTYDDVYEYRADEPGADLAGFPDWPRTRVPSPSQVQSETVAYRVNGCGYLTTSEMTGTIIAVTCSEAP